MVGSSEGKRAKVTSPVDSKAHGDILGNQTATIRDPIGNIQASPTYRGSVSFAIKGQPFQIDLAKYKVTEDICASKAIRITEANGEKAGQVTLDKGKCVLCGRCQEAAPDLFKIESMFTPSTKKRQN